MTTKTLLERIDEASGKFAHTALSGPDLIELFALLSDLRPLVRGESMAEHEAARANELFQRFTELGFHGGTISTRVSAEDAAIVARALKAYTGITK